MQVETSKEAENVTSWIHKVTWGHAEANENNLFVCVYEETAQQTLTFPDELKPSETEKVIADFLTFVEENKLTNNKTG